MASAEISSFLLGSLTPSSLIWSGVLPLSVIRASAVPSPADGASFSAFLASTGLLAALSASAFFAYHALTPERISAASCSAVLASASPVTIGFLVGVRADSPATRSFVWVILLSSPAPDVVRPEFGTIVSSFVSLSGSLADSSGLESCSEPGMDEGGFSPTISAFLVSSDLRRPLMYSNVGCAILFSLLEILRGNQGQQGVSTSVL